MFSSGRKLVIDIETNEVDFELGNEIDQIHEILCVSVLDIETNEQFTFYERPPSGDAIDGHRGNWHFYSDSFINMVFRAHTLVGHNIIGFDLPALEKIFEKRISKDTKIFDTLVASRLCYPDRPGGHKLQEWGVRLGYPKGEVEQWGILNAKLLEYCEQDVRLTRRVYDLMLRETKGLDQALKLEHRTADIMWRQQWRGMAFDIPSAKEFESFLKKELLALDNKILDAAGIKIIPGRDFPIIFKIDGDYRKNIVDYCSSVDLPLHQVRGPFTGVVYRTPDLNSPLQQKEILEKFGWQPTSFTPTGAPKLDDSIRDVPVIGRWLYDRNVLNDRLKKVSGLLEMVPTGTSIIHGGANPCGTPTGRMKHRRIVNIPRPSTPYGKELRSLFIARPGFKLVGYDAASLELRILAHYIGNDKYTSLVTSTDKTNDAHTLARDAAGAESRDVGKTLNYALIYGAGDAKLGATMGGGRAEGAAFRNNIFKLIPNFKQLMHKVEKAAEKGYLKGLDGRKLWLRSEHKALNTLIQGGGAIFMKQVAVALDEITVLLQRHSRAFKVLDMHDEAQWEVSPEYIDEFKLSVELAFKQAASDLKLRCPQAPEIKIGNNWMETH